MNPISPQMIAAIQGRAIELSKAWGLDPDLLAVGMLDSGNEIVGGDKVQYRALDEPLFNRKNHDSTATQLTFFDEAAAAFVTNVPNGQLKAGTVFGVENIGIELHTGYNRAGGAGAATSPSFMADTSAATVALAMAVASEAKRKALITGRLQLFSGNELVYDITGLDKLPIGAGIDAAVSGESTGTTTTLSAIHTNNGAPFAGNKRPIGRGRLMLPGNAPISAVITWPAACNLGSNVNGFWDLVLYGRVYRRK